MAWRIGIDEAGYGPNLGPLVMTAVACRLPDDLAQADLWSTLSAGVRRERRGGDRRLHVNDSKQVYSARNGLGDLETAVLGFLSATQTSFTCAAEMVAHLCPAQHEELTQEIWYHGQTRLPLACRHETVAPAAEAMRLASADREVRWGPVRSVVVCPHRFNDLVDRWDSKGAVLAVSLAELFSACGLAQAKPQAAKGDAAEPSYVAVDKHGGRNFYSALVQEAVGAGMTLAREESARRSVYDVIGLHHPLRITFMPRADGEDLCVALASMISKYLRELFMVEFNDFWQRHLPDLTPTAGYPGDAARFFSDIEPVRRKLKVTDRRLWRQR